MATIDDIKTRANLVKNATTVGENTAERVGGVLVDLADHVEGLEDDIDGNITTIKMRRDTASGFATNNPVLADGELGFETDRKRYKMGDGVTAWNALDYRSEELDEMPQRGSTNAVSSGGVYDAIHDGGGSVPQSNYYRLGIQGTTSYVATNIRVAVQMPASTNVVRVTSILSGYRVAIQAWNVSDPTVEPRLINGTLIYNSGWTTSPFNYVPDASINYIVVAISKASDAEITIAEAQTNVTINYATTMTSWDAAIQEFYEGTIVPLHYGYVPSESFNLTFTNKYSNVVQTHFEEGKKYRITIRFSVAPPQYVGVYLYVSTPSSGTQGFTLVGIQAGTQETTFEYVPASGLNYNYLRCYTNSTAALSATFTSEVYTEKTFVETSRVSEEELKDDTTIPTGHAITSFLNGTTGNVPTVSDIRNVSYNTTVDGFRTTNIRCMFRLPANVSTVTISSVASGYRYTFSKFQADDPSKDLLDITGVRISDTGWKTTPATYDCNGANLYLIHLSKSNDGNITPQDAFNGVTFTFDTKPFSASESDFPLNDANFSPVGTNGTVFDLAAHRCFVNWEFDSATYSLASQSPQGSAIYDGKLFVYFYSDTKLRVFDILTGALLSTITLSGVGHGNSMQFGSVVGANGFPLLYISGSVTADSPQNVIYVCSVTLSTATVVRTITLDENALTLQNCAFDWANEKMYALTFNNEYSGACKIVLYSVVGLEASTASTFTPTYLDSADVTHMGVCQGVSFCNNSFIVLISDYDEQFARLHFFVGLTLVDTWQWYMNDDSECQGVTPLYQDGRFLMIVPAWWRYASNQSWRYRLQYING